MAKNLEKGGLYSMKSRTFGSIGLHGDNELYILQLMSTVRFPLGPNGYAEVPK